MISNHTKINGSGKGAAGWFHLDRVNVSYDHPYDFPEEHALNLDFINETQGPGARLAVELSAESARALIETIQAVLAEAEAGHFLP